MEPSVNVRLQTVLKELRGSPSAWPFLAPVDWKGLGLTEYPKIISEPMDVKTVGVSKTGDIDCSLFRES